MNFHLSPFPGKISFFATLWVTLHALKWAVGLGVFLGGTSWVCTVLYLWGALLGSPIRQGALRRALGDPPPHAVRSDAGTSVRRV